MKAIIWNIDNLFHNFIYIISILLIKFIFNNIIQKFDHLLQVNNQSYLKKTSVKLVIL